MGSGAGFAMVFALLIAAIIWNLATWWLGLPASSSHTLIGSIIGVGVANALMNGRDGTAGVDWAQATKASATPCCRRRWPASSARPCCWSYCASSSRTASCIRNRGPTAPPPWWIRGLLVLTCTGVSFAHGSNDGQKGMGLIMLILVGTVPLTYGLNRAMPVQETHRFAAVAQATQQSPAKAAPSAAPADARKTLTTYIRTNEMNADVVPALAALTGSIGAQVSHYGEIPLAAVPADAVEQRPRRYVPGAGDDQLSRKHGGAGFDPDTQANVDAFKKALDGPPSSFPCG